MDKEKVLDIGGVTLKNAVDFFNAGALAVGIGSDLLDIKAILNDNFGEITRRAQKLSTAVKEVINTKV
jgi:2-dehydro-3-deoxyphosphogluconate aldolase/(4S)-4-hydroxy-2-oxoglutarate aldolase